jgi:hypothetical protein
LKRGKLRGRRRLWRYIKAAAEAKQAMKLKKDVEAVKAVEDSGRRWTGKS